MDLLLDQVEVRVFGSLMEKEMATPEYYPLSLNALVNACNQKTNRTPVMDLAEERVMQALQGLKKKRLVGQSDTGRVVKYWQDFTKPHNLIRREEALFCLLLLRGPQTPGELRARTERLCTFESSEELATYLDNLMERGLICKLPRLPGQKEQRFTHLLAGPVTEMEAGGMAPCATVQVPVEAVDRLAELEKSVETLREELEALKAEFLSFKKAFE